MKRYDSPTGIMEECSTGDYVKFEDLLKYRDEVLEEAAALCERVRCRKWEPEECAVQIRSLKNRGK
jgi:hypothetical protein